MKKINRIRNYLVVLFILLLTLSVYANISNGDSNNSFTIIPLNSQSAKTLTTKTNLLMHGTLFDTYIPVDFQMQYKTSEILNQLKYFLVMEYADTAPYSNIHITGIRILPISIVLLSLITAGILIKMVIVIASGG